MAVKYTVTIDQDIYKILLISEHEVEANGAHHNIDFTPLDDQSFSLILDGKTFVIERLVVQTEGGPESARDGVMGHTTRLSVKGLEFVARVDDDRSLLLRSLHTKPQSSSAIQLIRAPMPGMISRVEVQVGDEVTPGKGLLVLEAMKMENEIRSLQGGRVRTIHVEQGKPVEKGEPLVTIETI